MSEQKLLSICIPTFNRVDCLKYNLLSITDQFDIDPSLKDVVEIIISDNASSDSTKEMINGFTSKYSNIVYHRNETNIGFDRNLNNAVNLASGKYCFSLGDDDALFPGSLNILIKKIRDTQMPYYLVGRVGYSRDMERAYIDENHVNSQELSFNKLEDYVRSLDGYLGIIGVFGGMSTHVFLREVWVSFSDLNKYIDSLQIHTNVFLRAFKNFGVFVLPDPIVKTRGDNMRWEDIVGLETTQKRNMRAFKDFLWIKDLYNLPQSRIGAFVYFMGRGYWISFKQIVKKFLNLIKYKRHVVLDIKNSSINSESNIAFILFTLNEEKRIEYPVRNFINYGEVIVLDGGSTDKTGEIAQRLGAKFLMRPKINVAGAEGTKGIAMGETKEMLDFVLENTNKKWLFWQYVDDLAPKTLLEKLTEISKENKYKQVIVPLYTYLWGKTNYPAIKTSVGCFFQRDAVDFSNNKIHGMGRFLGKEEEKLHLPICDEYAIRHFSLYNLNKFANSHLAYAEAEAIQKYESGQKYSAIKMLAAIVRYFWLFYKDNWKNGILGLMEALAYSYFRLLAYFRLYEIENNITLENIEEQYIVEKKRIIDSL